MGTACHEPAFRACAFLACLLNSSVRLACTSSDQPIAAAQDRLTIRAREKIIYIDKALAEDPEIYLRFWPRAPLLFWALSGKSFPSSALMHDSSHVKVCKPLTVTSILHDGSASTTRLAEKLLSSKAHPKYIHSQLQ